MKTLIPAVGLVSCFAAAAAMAASAPPPYLQLRPIAASSCQGKAERAALAASARNALRRVYIAEKAYFQTHDTYSPSLSAIGFAGADACLSVGLVAHIGPVGDFFATARSIDKTGPTWCVADRTGIVHVSTAPITSAAACEALAAG
jgi:hypothetical protein